MNDEKTNQASFIGHLAELRSRLIKSFVYLFILMHIHNHTIYHTYIQTIHYF